MTSLHPRILSVKTGHPPGAFTQEEIVALMGISDPRRVRFFEHPHIHRRHFLFDGNFREESMEEQRRKFQENAPRLSSVVIREALAESSVNPEDVACLVAVTASGFFTPGLSVMVTREMAFSPATHRLDLSGIGCHAGVTALQATSDWCEANPGKTAVLLCAELGSCIYNLDPSDNNALVNSLFGDGIAVIVLCAEEKKDGAHLLGFRSHLIPHTEEFLRFDWLPARNLFGFHVHKKTPEMLGKSVGTPVAEFLKEHGLKKEDITEWVVHGGGEAILSAVQTELSLSDDSLRHTRSVLRDYGNVASGSFLFSFERLLAEKKLKRGDRLVFMAMGPGLSLELALAEWS